jgi:hypothetical protein
MTEYRTNVMLAKLGVHYGSPDKDAAQAKKIFSEYARLMTQYSDHELSEAADLVLKRHRYRTWPSIAECISALEDYRRSVHEKTAPEVARKVSYPEWSQDRIANADRLVNCGLGRRAAAEGWVLGLHDFCRNHERLPTEREIPAIIAGARFVDRFLAGAVNRHDLDLPVPPGPALQMDAATRAKWRALAESMLAKRDAIGRKIEDAA